MGDAERSGYGSGPTGKNKQQKKKEKKREGEDGGGDDDCEDSSDRYSDSEDSDGNPRGPIIDEDEFNQLFKKPTLEAHTWGKGARR